ncbi:MAG: ChaN family lipoprotein [Gammaproteobacteria bacterium]|jgi:uncharacterized iron-regulated protein|nr:ChaN family lipoprotein [Gammaproteobacteria bacterium]
MVSVTLMAASLTAGAAERESDLRLPIGDPLRKDKQVEVVIDAITDTATGELIGPGEMAKRLADVGLVFVGETHTNIDYHNAQLKVIQELYKAGRNVMIGLEMFPYTQQANLDTWSRGGFTEAEFVEKAKWYTYWGYNWEYYREIFLYAQENNIPMYGVNTPREVVTAVRKKGFQDLTDEEAAHIPNEVLPVSDDQRRMYKSFFDPADTLHMSDEQLDGMLRAQSTWDATMGWNALQALKQHGGDNAIMVVLIGSGHVTYGLGAERQTEPYYAGQIASIIPVQIDPAAPAEERRVQASYANYIWGLPEARAEVYPSLGVSLMGSLGDQPTKIIQVSGGSVAERAGLQVGDVLLSLNGVEIADSVALRSYVSTWRWGDMARARVERDGEPRDILVPVRRARGGAY